MNAWKILVSSALLASVATAYSPQDPESLRVPECQSDQITLKTDGENGNFNGMSHSGTLLVVRNISAQACSLQPMIHVVFRDSQNKVLKVASNQADTAFKGPIPMGHGPVVLPIVLAAGREAKSALRWVAGPVYPHSVCVDPAFISLETGGRAAQHSMRWHSMSGHICSPDADHMQVTATRLALDSVQVEKQ